MSRRKYKQGNPVRTMQQFALSESNWFIWNGKTTHRSFLISLQYRVLEDALKSGTIFEAIPIESEKEV